MVGFVGANLARSGSLLLSACRSHSGHRPLVANAVVILVRNNHNLYYNNNHIHIHGKIANRQRQRQRHTSPFASSLMLCRSSTSEAETEVAEGSGDVGDLEAVKDVANRLDMRVGCILKAWRHEEADSLYVEEVDIGEPEPRIICSGLVNYIPLDHLQGASVVVMANLKPRNMRGVKSCGMLMAASDASRENIELLIPPEGSMPGDRIWFGSESDQQHQHPPATPNQVAKKKMWESVQPHLKTDASCNAVLGEHFMRTSTGVVASSTLKNANIS